MCFLVKEKYRVDHSELGHGHYGVVRKCQNRQTKEYFAVKTIKKSKVGRLETLKREIEILKTMDHPNIIKLYDVFEDDKYLHLVTELCTGGEVGKDPFLLTNIPVKCLCLGSYLTASSKKLRVQRGTILNRYPLPATWAGAFYLL